MVHFPLTSSKKGFFCEIYCGKLVESLEVKLTILWGWVMDGWIGGWVDDGWVTGGWMGDRWMTNGLMGGFRISLTWLKHRH